MTSQASRGQAFKALHARDGAFVIPNPWDAGSAKLLAALGFPALATTSAGLAFSLGRPDGEGALDLEQTLANARGIVEATPLPVSADLENGFSATAEGCAEAIRRAAAVGLVGASIEDASGDAALPIHPFEDAVQRVRAAAQAVRGLDFPFMLTARAENLLHGRDDLRDTLRRLEAYAEAGADVLYAPGLIRREDIAAAVRAVAPKPLNVLMGLSGSALSVDELAGLGVRRISVGSSLARAAYSGFFQAAQEIANSGTFAYAARGLSFAELNEAFR
ncbi:isocitrate lyase/phosphoenolpyruvate mutase family protein [Pseudomonas sp. PS02288]|uniref:isocitrate lyase/PEP mutase family protein n=1 Tax=Pseudomonas sp. PS02288 TaxID=2991443 RepID=UPI00249AB7FD|nr:isocitrate lyase/phosphoenolpyruvate mutase family protein [Pseudomonas sp. PS02288]